MKKNKCCEMVNTHTTDCTAASAKNEFSRRMRRIKKEAESRGMELVCNRYSRNWYVWEIDGQEIHTGFYKTFTVLEKLEAFLGMEEV